MRVVNKIRFGTFVVVVVMTIALLFVVVDAIDTPNIIGYDTYYVLEGDTLWDIAKTSNGYDHIITDELVYEIKTASDLDTASLQIGDIVKVPIYDVE